MEKDPLGTRNRETKVYAEINIRNAMVDDADTFIHIISGKSRHVQSQFHFHHGKTLMSECSSIFLFMYNLIFLFMLNFKQVSLYSSISTIFCLSSHSQYTTMTIVELFYLLSFIAFCTYIYSSS